MARAAYTDADKAKVYVVLTTNDGNVKRTARETGVPENTVRRWKKWFEDNGPPDLEEVETQASDFVATANEVRFLAIESIRTKVENGEGNIAQLTTLVGVLTDKIDRAAGIALGRVEHQVTLPSPDEIREALGAVVQGAVLAARQRQEEIIDADFVEQSPRELPSPR